MIGLFFVLVHSSTVLASTFYHEPSYIEIKPPEKLRNADFGFSIAFQNGTQHRLVVGSPHDNQVGQVYSCPLDNILKNSKCEKLGIDVNELSKYYGDYKENDKRHKFCLGATVAATSNYILTCAPLWSSTIMYPPANPEPLPGPYGTCFVYYNKDKVHRFQGLLEQYIRKHNSNKRISETSMYGGIGWSSLVDESTGLIFIGKPAVFGDIQYIFSNKPVQESKSIKNQAVDYFTENPNNIGYALAAGRFFRNIKENVYAFSLQDIRAVGKVSFLQFNRRVNVELSSPVAGSLYGAALHGADLDKDGASDLLVGAPAHRRDYDEGVDSGAVYLHLGGDERTLKTAICVIMGKEDGSRFGTTIAASDLDGDSLPEIFVSAPYENSGIGAMYILSGYEVNKLLSKLKEKKLSSSQVLLPDMKLTQRIQIEKFRSYGYSLQVLPDIDNNGCHEIVAGVPRNATVVLLWCVPAINATMSIKLLNEMVKENDKNFTVQVCVNISYLARPATISTKFFVSSEIIGSHAKIAQNAKFDIDLKNKTNKNPCEKVVVEFERSEQGLYRFTTKLKSDVNSLLNKTEFDPSWVRLSPYSKTNDSFEVTRHCAEADCTPKLHLQILWSGSENTTSYRLGSSSKENVTISVVNRGGIVYDACVKLRFVGAQMQLCQNIWNPTKYIPYDSCSIKSFAQVLSIPCANDDTGVYTCYLKKPLTRNDTSSLDIIMNMAKANNAHDKLHIEAFLFNNCNHDNSTKIEKDIKLIFDTKQINITGPSHSFNMSDSEILNQKQSLLEDTHEYMIMNNGSMYWENVDAVISLPKKSFIVNHRLTTSEKSLCVEKEDTNVVVFNCKLNLPPNSTTIVILNIQLLKTKIEENVRNKVVEMKSNLKVKLKPTDSIVSHSQFTTIFFQRQLSIGNNKTVVVVISVILALLLLALLAYILYRVGFFKRKEKDRLESLRASVRGSTAGTRNGEKKSTTSTKDDENMDDFNMEVVEDCAFDPVEVSTTADNATLIVECKEKQPPKHKEDNNIAADSSKDSTKM